jgi:hypothetical protein
MNKRLNIMNHIKKSISFITRKKIVFVLIILFLLSSKYVCVAQLVSLGWEGTEIIPLNLFSDKDNWICGFQNGTGDSSFVTSDDTCVYLHWKFGPGKRYKYAQAYQVVIPSFSLANKHIVGLDVMGSVCNNNRNIQIKFEDGTNQSYYRWDGLAGITRWCERIVALKKQFVNTDQLRWDSIKVISLEINSFSSDGDIAPDSGVAAFRMLKADSLSSWVRASSFETIRDSGILTDITRQTISALLNRQNQNTGLFYTWLTDKTSYLYGQGLVLKILSMEGKWENSQPLDSCSIAAEKLALFLVNHQDKLGFWPRSWHTETGAILQNVEDDGTVWMGDFPWMITGLQNYYNKSGDSRVKIALEKARNFLYYLIENDGKFYTINPDTREKFEVTSGEAYAAAILSVYEMSDSTKAENMLQYIDSRTWDTDLKYWKESTGSARIVLFANTWLSPFFKNSANKQKSLDALSFVGKALLTKGPGDPYGFDGIGPVATWFEGTLSYICAGGPGSDSLFYNLIKYRYPDGTIPHYNDAVSVAGIWAVKWSSLDGTSWLYFAASGKSPFERGTALNREGTEPKKVFIHYMGWYGAGSDGWHWGFGHPRTPLIGYYNSKSWATQMYHILLSSSCGIDGMIMNQNDEYDKQSVKNLLSTIKRIRDIDSVHFKFDLAISYDDQGMDRTKPFDTATITFNYLKDHILPNTNNYLYYYDKPAAFVFNYPGYLTAHDYNSALNNVFGNSSPLLLWNQIDDDAVDYIDASYPWVGPDNKGWYDNGRNWGKDYLKWYYDRINYWGLHLQFAIGGVWPGFDDRQCSWSQNRWMDRQDGMVYDSTWIFVNSYQQLLPLKWVIIETWNDWNEGTEIEPSQEFGYKYLKSTIKNINAYKDTTISEDTCKFEAAKKIYQAANLIELTTRDSAIYYPLLTCAIIKLFANDCLGAISCAESIINPTDINDFSFSGKIMIYPNPTTGQLKISVNQTIGSDYKIEVYNNLGKLMQPIMKNKIGNKFRIDLTDYPAGIYLIKLYNKEKIYFSKIIKE